MCHEIYRLRVVEGLEVAAIVEKLGISRSRVYRALTIFEVDNPQKAAMVKRQQRKITKSYWVRSPLSRRI